MEGKTNIALMDVVCIDVKELVGSVGLPPKIGREVGGVEAW